uniref:Putative ovule protein n=1 Tax=Solanum chacoense TaxID=4108 RepID=A0A0V0HKR1_SOLCH
MVADAVNQVEGAQQGASSMISSKLETVATQGKAPTCLANENVLKARKPYTITKQREKWTEEEHQRFLEALKLYGRAWRQIEGKCGIRLFVPDKRSILLLTPPPIYVVQGLFGLAFGL